MAYWDGLTTGDEGTDDDYRDETLPPPPPPPPPDPAAEPSSWFETIITPALPAIGEGTNPPPPPPPPPTGGPNLLTGWQQPLNEVLPPPPNFSMIEGPTTPYPEYAPGPSFTAPGYTQGPAYVAPQYQQRDPFVAPTMAEVMNDPGYAFGMREGRRTIENSAAAAGILRHGNTWEDLIQYGSDYATTKYGDVYGRRQQEWQMEEDAGRYAHEAATKAAKDTSLINEDQRRYAYAAFRPTARPSTSSRPLCQSIAMTTKPTPGARTRSGATSSRSTPPMPAFNAPTTTPSTTTPSTAGSTARTPTG